MKNERKILLRIEVPLLNIFLGNSLSGANKPSTNGILKLRLQIGGLPVIVNDEKPG